MPRYRRLDGFLIQPALILNDPAFLAMSDAARLAYLMLLLRLWQAKEPGTAPDNDRVLASLASVSEDQWRIIRCEIEPAFRINDGKWISQQMVETHRQQIAFLEARAKGGKSAQAKLRAESKLSPEDGDGEVEESSQHPSPTDVGGWVSDFDSFWKAYPRRVGKKAARKSWDRLKGPERSLPTILQAIETAKTSEQWQRDGGQYIPHPATWLNQGRWDDAPIETPRQGPIGLVPEPEPDYMRTRERSPDTPQHVRAIIDQLAKAKEIPT